MVDTGPKFYAVLSPPLYMTLRSRSRTWSFYVKVFRTSLFPNLVMDLVHMMIDTGYRLKRIFMLNFCYVSFCKAFNGFDSCLA